MGRLSFVSIVTLLLALLLMLVGCDGTNNGVVNPHTPTFGSFVSPAMGSTDQINQITFQWTCSDPDGDSITYDFYLGDETAVAIHTSDVVDTFITVTDLKRSSKYYWYVVAKVDGRYQTKSRRAWFRTNDVQMYPLKVGNYWTYDGYSGYTECVNSGSDYYTEYTSATVTVIDDTRFFEGSNVYVIEEHGGTVLGGRYAISYYSNRPDGLYYLGGRGDFTPKQSTDMLPVEFNGLKFRSIDELVLALTGYLTQHPSTGQNVAQEYSALLSLKYPILTGDQWTFREPGNPWRIDKKINGRTAVTTEAGTFDCWEVEWLYDFEENEGWNFNIIFLDYISEVGLVKRVMEFEGVIISGMDGSVIDTCTLMIDRELTSYGTK